MTFLCATRHVKNARYLQATAPRILSTDEPPAGFASRVPFELLGRLHALRPGDLAGHPDLAEALRRSPIPQRGTRIAGSLFSGSLIFAQVSFRTRNGTVSVAPADLKTAMDYSRLAVTPVSRYAAQYGPNQPTVSLSPVPFTVDIPTGRYNDQTLQRWVNAIVLQTKPPGNVCIVILNPAGVVNTDADPSHGVGGYHGLASVPYCFVNAMGSGFTLADPQNRYALALSHEIAEMVVDPQANLANPEVCDGCGPNCQTPWIGYFDSSGGYLGTSQSFPPPFAYVFFINGIVKPVAATACPAPATACNYAPP
ncbi:MAG: hypothetical protein L3J78_00755 [Thermoplasmata archaeon]|nr:hypothetical protein [Thermoplasmata archaeon]